MSDYRSCNDIELTGLLKSGDQRAFAEIYNRYKRLLYLFAYKRLGEREEVTDIVQDVFLSLWQNHEHIEISYTLNTYLHSAVRNKIVDKLARRQVSQRYIETFELYRAAASSTTDHLVRSKELEAIIEKEIAALPPKMRQVFELSRKTHLTRAEIAAELDLSEQTVKSHVQHALKILKVQLKNNFIFL